MRSIEIGGSASTGISLYGGASGGGRLSFGSSSATPKTAQGFITADSTQTTVDITRYTVDSTQAQTNL